MRYCPQCGIANEDSRQQCLRCQADLPAQAAVKPAIVVEASRLPGSHDYPSPSLHDPYAAVRLVAPPAVDNEFLDEFSWGPGCGFYFFSNAMTLFLALALVALGFELGTGTLSQNYRHGGGSEAVIALLVLAEVGTLYGLLFWAGQAARRRRWSRLRWRDFEHFRQDELKWKNFGIIGWALQILITLVSLVLSLAAAIHGAR